MTPRVPAPPLHFPLALASICVNCDAVYEGPRACPACMSEHFVPLDRFLTPKKEAA